MRTDSLVEYIDKLDGIATAAQLKEAGFTPGLIGHAYKRGAIDKLTRGVYCSAGVFDDEFAAVSARWKKCILPMEAPSICWDFLTESRFRSRPPSRMDTIPKA